jgi:2-polyprenyl-3-methyl-5-hydroxy-6-metoxy-1,4-benzoquinol methylase
MSTEVRDEAYGQEGLSPVDRFGVWLSQRAILPHVRPGVSLLDLGCGFDATLLRSLAPRLSSGTGVDVAVSDEARATPRLDFVVGPLEEVLPRLDEGRFDVITLISVLEHLSDAQAALDRIHTLLAPGGTLLVNVPTWLGKAPLEISAFRLGLSPAVEMDDHKMYYDRRDLWPLLVRAGFAPSRIRLRRHKFGLNLFAVARRAE